MIRYKNHSKEGKFNSDEFSMWHIAKGKSIYIFKSFFYLYWEKGCFFFRFFNKWGVHGVKDSPNRFVLWSERMKIVKRVKIFGWVFKRLN